MCSCVLMRCHLFLWCSKAIQFRQSSPSKRRLKCCNVVQRKSMVDQLSGKLAVRAASTQRSMGLLHLAKFQFSLWVVSSLKWQATGVNVETDEKRKKPSRSQVTESSHLSNKLMCVYIIKLTICPYEDLKPFPITIQTKQYKHKRHNSVTHHSKKPHGWLFV